jgi:IclR family transcriptional regulator, pca regulon regulatory protein
LFRQLNARRETAQAGQVKSAGRVLDVLELFGELRAVLGVSDVARRLAIPKSSAQGLLLTLAGRGYLEREGSAYALAGPLQEQGWTGGSRARLLRLAQPVMDGMARESGESVFLGVMTANLDIQYIAKATSAAELRYDASLAHRRPAYCTTIGMVILANSDPAARDRFFSRVKLRRLTERTPTDAAVLRRLLVRVARLGYAELRDTNQPGVSGVSAPVFGGDGGVIAGLNLGAPSARFVESRDRLIEIVKREAAALSARLARGRSAA